MNSLDYSLDVVELRKWKRDMLEAMTKLGYKENENVWEFMKNTFSDLHEKRHIVYQVKRLLEREGGDF